MQTDPFLLEALGLVAACLTTLSFLPQALKIWRLGTARDVSLTMYLMMASGQILWWLYGYWIDSLSLLVANTAGFILVSSVLGLKLAGKGEEAVEVEAVTPGGPAEKAGLRAEDVIVTIEGKAVDSPQEVPAAVQSAGAGATLKVGENASWPIRSA